MSKAAHARTRSRHVGCNRRAIAVSALLLTAACAPAGPTVVGPVPLPVLATEVRPAPPPSDSTSCWETVAQPAIFETVTEQVLVMPPRRDDSGAILVPASYRTETRQREVQARLDGWFRGLCPAEKAGGDVAFVATLQRALKARGFFPGAITGEHDPSTRAAIRSFQSALGLDSDRLSYAAAQRLGLISSLR